MTIPRFHLEREFTLGLDTMTNSTKPNTLTLHDPLRAAVLMTAGIALLDCPPNPSNQSRMTFLFDDTNDAARLASGAIAEDRLMPIGRFLESLRRCNELLHLYRISRHEEGRRDSR